jgi:RNA exonuclease 4
MTAFFTKKQKIKMRERQRRMKKKEEGGDADFVNKQPPKVKADKTNDRRSHSPPNKPSIQESVEIVRTSQEVVTTAKTKSVKRETKKAEVKQQQQQVITATVSNDEPPLSSSSSSSVLTIVVPKDLTGANARKFRKDARRKAREQGQDESKLVFVVQGEDNYYSAAPMSTEDGLKTELPPLQQGTSTFSSPTTTSTAATTSKTKSKRPFPCLKDLVEQEKQAKRRRVQEEQRQQEDNELTEEYKARYVALDCEMVGIGSQGRTSALARVSLVDWNGQVLLDTFVQVPTRVTDFRTHVSGVTPQHLKQAAAMDINTCRDQVAALLKHKILVGHALHNDLSALMLQHPKEDRRDTATHRPFQRLYGSKSGRKVKWRPRKLRDLVKEHVQLEIQAAGQAHDSVQDAWAAMQLFQTVRSSWEQELSAEPKHKQKKKAGKATTRWHQEA